MSEINTGTKKGKVEYVLSKNEQARNSDKILIELYWKTWDRKFIAENDAGDWVLLRNMVYLTSPESIRRCRQKFQEEGQYPATDPVVIERRNKEKGVRFTINKENFDRYLPD